MHRDREGNERKIHEEFGGLDSSMHCWRQAQSASHMALSLSYEEMLAQAVAYAGVSAFGCVFVEVWVMSDDDTKLTRPSGGRWMDPAFVQSFPSASLKAKAWEVYHEAVDCPPGAGLVGTMAQEGGLDERNVHWRQIKTLLEDPFVQRARGRRMKQIFDLGIGIVAAVPFCFQGDRGMVLYFSRSSADAEMLHAESNALCLLGSADLIGANYTIRKAHKESAELRQKRYRESARKVRKTFLHENMSLASVVMNAEHIERLKKEREQEAAHRLQENADGRGWGTPSSSLEQFAGKMANKAYQAGSHILKRIRVSRRKWRGAKLQGPPRHSPTDCLFSFTGVFLTMLTILKIAKSLRVGGRFDFDGGWYSSTLCIIFALTPAPVGQPRQIFAAHLWNMLVGLACRQIPIGGFGDFMERTDAPPDAEYGLPLIWVQALAVALGISGQAYMGILHPPATGLSMTFASKPQWTLSTIASVMLTDVVVVAISVLFLNFAEHEQYPMFWLGLGWSSSGGTIGAARWKMRSTKRRISAAKTSATKSIENIYARITPTKAESACDSLTGHSCESNQFKASYGSLNIPLWHSIDEDGDGNEASCE